MMTKSILTTVLVLSTSAAHAAEYHLQPLWPGSIGQDETGLGLPIATKFELDTLRGNIVSAEVPFGGMIRLGLPDSTFDVEVRDTQDNVYGAASFAPGLGQPALEPATGEPLGWANKPQGEWLENFDNWPWWGAHVYTLVDLDIPMLEQARGEEGEVVLWWHQAGGPSWDVGLVGWPLLVETDAPAGDFNNNGLVEQGDLDMVLGKWGAVPTFPNHLDNNAWWNDRPEGIVSQAQLDQVLGAWGQGVVLGGTAVPEPPSWLLVPILVIGFIFIRICQRQWPGGGR